MPIPSGRPLLGERDAVFRGTQTNSIELMKTFTPSRLLSLVLLCLLLVTGCRSSRSKSSAPELRISTSPDPQSEVPVLPSSPTIQELVRFAALNSPTVKASFERWQAAESRIAVASALPDPKVTYANYIREVETRVGPQNQRFGLSQTLPTAGKRRLRGARAAASAEALKLRYEGEIASLVYQVKEAYFERVYIEYALRIAQENLDLLTRLESVGQAGVRVGKEASGVVEAQLAMGQIEEDVRRLIELRTPLSAALNALLGREAMAPLEIPSGIEFRELPETAMAAIEQSGLKENEELRALEKAEDVGDIEVRLAEKEYWPDLTVGIDYWDTGEARSPGVMESGKDPVMLMASFNLPIWFHKIRGKIESAKAERESLIAKRQGRELDLQSQFQMSLFKLRETHRRAELYEKDLMPLAQSALETAEIAYTSGRAGFAELVDAQRRLLDLQLSQRRAQIDREIEWARLEKLRGNPIAPESNSALVEKEAKQ